ncbi:HEAT repeat domain-containing protein [Actinoplanes sp. G11-F43]|uniref:HEAT repeat domain-containing protein n=1 Tax=Actinoplanes sp. G11-F43 TaxID=3424130 RepID=UPI003D33AD27
MLETLSSVSWARLGHAYGSAADVPERIRALCSGDAEVRRAARRSLNGTIIHQGTRYEATAHAVPFLLELLADPVTPDRAELLELLTPLAIGFDESWLPGRFPVASYREQASGGEPILRAAPLPSYDDDSVFRYLEQLDDHGRESMFAYIELSAYDAVRAGVPLFVDLLAGDDPRLRVAAAYALAWFPEETAVSRPALTAAATDPDPVVAATALVALALTADTDPGVLRAGLDDDRKLVRWGAAVALAALEGPACDRPVVDELLGWAARGTAGHARVPYLEGDLSGLAGLALRRLGDDHADAAFEALLVRIPAVSGPDALPVVGEALRRAFPSGELPSATGFTDLDEPQQRLLRSLADSPTTWQHGGEGVFTNFTLLLHAYALPGSADDMRTFITR